MGKKCYHAIQNDFPLLFYIYVLADRTPTGEKSQNTGFWGHFGLGRPRTVTANPGPGRKGETKHNFPVLGALLEKKICPLQNYLPGSAQLFAFVRFGRLDPHGQEIAEYRFFRPFWRRTALGTSRKPQPGPKTEKNAIFRC